MGVHVSKVRSLRLDLWDLPTVEVRTYLLCSCVSVYQPCCCVCASVRVCACVCVSSDAQFMESKGNLKVNDLYEKQLPELEVEKPQANASK